MANRKSIWDTMDKLEGRKDSSFSHLEKERKRQGYDKKETIAKKMKKSVWDKPAGIHEVKERKEWSKK